MSKPFKNEYVSFSRLKRFEQCPRSFYLHYIEKTRSEPNDALLFGSAIHMVLERAYLWVQKEKYTGKWPDDLLLSLFAEEWMTSGLVGFDLFEQGHAILRGYEARFPTVDYETLLSVEQEFHLPVGDFEVFGKIDRVDVIDEETIAVVDYKTNRALFTRDEVDTDLQLSIYRMAAKQIWPWAKNIRLMFDMLRHDVMMETERDEEQLDAARAYIITLSKQTEQSDEYPAKLNKNCGYCDHRTSCDAYQEALAGNAEVVKSDPNSLELVARERERVATLAKILYGRKSELEKILKSALQDSDELNLGGMVYRMSRTSKVTYPVEATLRVLDEVEDLDAESLREELIGIDKTKVDALLKRLGKSMPKAELRMLKERLSAVADTKVTPRFYAAAAR